MAQHYQGFLARDAVDAARHRYFGTAAKPVDVATGQDPLGVEEIAYLGTRDSFYLSSISETGWPYVQHRGGPPGFLRVIDPTHLAFGDVTGNRQLLSTGNLAKNPRVSLFLIDYARRERLKILGIADVIPPEADPDLAQSLVVPPAPAKLERIFRITVQSFDWNCSKYITPRFSRAEVDAVVAPLRARIAELETQLISSS